MELFELLAVRRSVRQYTEEPVSRKALEKNRGGRADGSQQQKTCTVRNCWWWRDRSVVKDSGPMQAPFCPDAEQAPAAIVVMGRLDSHAWVEDASAALMAMMLQATELGLGSCWVQVRHMTAEKVAPTDSASRPISTWQNCWSCRKGWKWKPSWPWAMGSKNSAPGRWRKLVRNGSTGKGFDEGPRILDGF